MAPGDQDVRAALLAAKKAIEKKDFAEALEKCEVVMAAQPKNNIKYQVFVFMGVAHDGLSQPQDAVKAYKSAIEIDQEKFLAWNGLGSFYAKSKKPEDMAELEDVYQKQLQILALKEGQAAEIKNIRLKLAGLQESLGKMEDALTSFYQVMKDSMPMTEMETGEAVAGSKNPRLEVLLLALEMLQRQPAFTSKSLDKLDKVYADILAEMDRTDASPEMEMFWKNYLDHLLKTCQIDLLTDHCLHCQNVFPQSSFPLLKLIQIHIAQQLCLQDAAKIEFPQVVERLCAVDPESPFLTLAHVWQCLLNAQYKEAQQLITAAKSALPQMVSSTIIEAEVALGLHLSGQVKKMVQTGEELLKRKSTTWSGDKQLLKERLQLLEAGALAHEGQIGCQQALKISAKLLDGKWKRRAQLYQLAAYLLLRNTDDAKQVLDEMRLTADDDVLCLAAHYHFLMQDFTTAQDKLEQVNDGCALRSFWLARIQWEQARSDPQLLEGCLDSLLKAAKLDAYHSDTFLYLGHYYSHQAVADISKAQRCYQKAYNLNPYNEEIGAALTDAMVTLGQEEAATHLLLTVTKQASAGSAKWAWLRLGLQQMKQDATSDAILSLQSALRADPKDSAIWECLGEAYDKRGSYTSAMKAFTRAAELAPDPTYCRYQIATIKKLLGEYAEAIDEYNKILEDQVDYVPALKGLGETHLLLGRSACQKFLHGRAVAHCQSAIRYLTAAVSSRPDFSCLWKLIGDACTLVHPLATELAQMDVPTKLLGHSGDMAEMHHVGKTEILSLGGRCYGMALKLQPESPSLWHDLGLNYFYQSQNADALVSQLSNKAVQAMHQALTIHADNHLHWTALGVIAASKEVDDPGLAQHCFIKSLQLEPSNVVAWTNLGTLYLKNDETKLAHEAFKVAQSHDPAYVACWIGQAVIAELVGHHDAMDLFRHTTELGIHIEGSIGYAHWVCSTLREKVHLDQAIYRYCIEQMAAVPAAIDALARYTDRERTNAAAFNMYGLLLERMKLYKLAVGAFKSAVELLADKPGVKLNQARSNYARLLCQVADYEQSVAQYKELGDGMSLEDASFMALSYYRLGQYDNSAATYQAALNLADDNAQIAELHVALGLVAYKTGDVEKTKSELFRSFQCSSASAAGLRALCALGLLQSDGTLVNAALDELDRLQPQDHIEDLVILRCHFLVLQRQVSAARNVLLKAIHHHPQRMGLWRRVALFITERIPSQCNAAVHCVRVAMERGAKLEDTKMLATLLSIGSTGAGLHSTKDLKRNCVQLAQKAIHENPDLMTNWCGLLAALYADEVKYQDGGQRKDRKELHNYAIALGTHLLSKVESELTHGKAEQKSWLQSLHLWTVQQYVLFMLTRGRTDQASQFLQQAAWLYDSDFTLRALLAFLEQDYSELRTLVQNGDQPFLWQLLSSALESHGLYGEVEKCAGQSVANSGQDKCVTIASLLIRAQNALRQILDQGQNVDKKWHAIFKEVSTHCLSIDQENMAMRLLLALYSLTYKNKRMAKEQLYHVVCGGGSDTTTSQARMHLYEILKSNKENKNSTETLVNDAMEAEDENFLEFYNSITKS